MSNTNTSATGGYLIPAAQAPLPGSLTFQQFLQSILVGISNLDGTLVRPKYQPNPPKQLDINVNWIAFWLLGDESDTNAYTGVDANGNNVFQRQEELEIQCSFYGPDSYEIAKLTRDGFQIPQNAEAMRAVQMGVKNTGKLVRMPDLVNERFIDRWEMSIYLRRQVMRTYPVLNFVSADGTIKSVINGSVKTIAWNAE